MPGIWTIEYAGTEKSAAAWGLNADPFLRLRTQSPTEFQFRMAGADPQAATPFPFEAPVIIRQNRTGSGTTWADDASADHYIFRGRQITNNGIVSGAGQSVTLLFKDAWDDLEKTPFQQSWLVLSGSAYFSRAYLFYNPATPSVYLTVAEQLAAIITFAVAAGINIAAGTIEGPSQMPWYGVRGLSCADAIRKCLECFPDHIAWIDTSVNPPQFNCRLRAHLTSVDLPYKGSDNGGLRHHKSTRISPLYDLRPSQVVIQYQKTITTGGTSYVDVASDVYPALSTGLALRALVVPIDLRGSNTQFVTSKIVTQAFDPTNLSWWQSRVSSLRDTDIDTGSLALIDSTINNSGSTHVQGIKVVDSSGTAINYASNYPREMIAPSRWATWTGVDVIEATVTAYFSYTKSAKIGSASSARTSDKVTRHMHTTKIKLCNAPLGTNNYQTTTAYDSGEFVITGLAQSLYDSLNQLQFDGSHEIVEEVAVTQIIGPWNVLNLTGGDTTWETMAACIPAVEIDFFRNTTSITIGPARHLSPQDLNHFLQFFRGRVVWDNANLVNGVSNTAGLSIAGESPGEDSVTAHPQQALKEFRDADATTGTNTNAMVVDPANGQAAVVQFDSAGGTLTTGKVAPEYSGAGAPASGTLVSGAQYRVGDKYFDTSGNGFYRCTTAGSNSSSVWVQISGAGGSSTPPLTQFKFISDGGDYILAKSWDGTTLGPGTFRLYKPWSLRVSLTTETINSVVHNYTYSPSVSESATGYTRTDTTSTIVETQTVQPPFLTTDVVYGAGCAQKIGSIYCAILIAIVSGGTAYAANQVLKVVGGTFTVQATVKILTVNGSGGILTWVIVESGNYTVAPSAGAATSYVTGSGGSGATATMTIGQYLLIGEDGRSWAR